MALDEYQRKRDFERTPEPEARKAPSKSGRLYLVQKHRARLLHYDIRLELDGVLLSWAIPKGPSLDPTEKRLAVHTEDHPVAYGSFEGIIPEGEYGGGTVMLWDQGEWEPVGDSPAEDHQAGKIKFRLKGEKLTGGWTLVRMKGHSSEGGKNWLLVKERDEAAKPETEYCVIEAEPFSVVTDRSLLQITEDCDLVWTGGGAQETGHAAPPIDHVVAPAFKAFDPLTVAGAQTAEHPEELEAMTPADTDQVPAGDDWLHEVEFRGERLRAFIEWDEVVLLDAEGLDWSRILPDHARAFAMLPVHRAIVDGVVTVLNKSGLSDKTAFDESLPGRLDRITFHAFDLPFLEGHDLQTVPLVERKGLLRSLIDAAPSERLLFSEHISGNGPAVFEQACRLGSRALISKKSDSTYEPGASGNWLRCACQESSEASDDAANNDDIGAAAPKRKMVVIEPGLDYHGVRLTTPSRLLYADQRVTKRTLVAYYESVADYVLPHVAGRPLSLYRCPGGFERECFFQKHLNMADPEHLHRVTIERKKEEDEDSFIYVEDLAGLITMVQWNVLEIHPWGSRIDDVDKPDRLIFDLDPGAGVTWAQLSEAALLVREVLDDVGLDCFAKTSGGKGIHVVVPLVRRAGWDAIKSFAKAVSEEIVRRNPQRYLATMTKAKRTGKIFVDYFRNMRGSTCTAPYSPRAASGAPISTPMTWDELPAGKAGRTLDHFIRRLATQQDDPWSGFFDCKQSITQAMRKKVGAR